MHFDVLGEISDIETFAIGTGIREIARLRRTYGLGRWRKRKGIAHVRLSDGSIRFAELHWYEASDRPQRIQNQTTVLKMAKSPAKQLVVCIDNKGYVASLETRKIYVALRDLAADKDGMLRVIDESGEDYLFPRALFRPIALPLAVKRAVLAA